MRQDRWWEVRVDGLTTLLAASAVVFSIVAVIEGRAVGPLATVLVVIGAAFVAVAAVMAYTYTWHSGVLRVLQGKAMARRIERAKIHQYIREAGETKPEEPSESEYL